MGVRLSPVQLAGLPEPTVKCTAAVAHMKCMSPREPLLQPTVKCTAAEAHMKCMSPGVQLVQAKRAELPKPTV